MKFNLAIMSSIVLLSGCESLFPKENEISDSFIPSYVTIPPITLPPIAPEIKDTLSTIAQNTKGAKVLPYDMDLLVLPATSVKAQYSFFDVIGSGSTGVFSLGGNASSRKVIYDVMQMATYPMPVKLKVSDKVDDEGQKIIISPFIGVGMRITVEYESTDIDGNLSLAALAAQIATKKGSGTLSIEQFGISRYGAANQAITGMEITPDNIDTLYRNISTIMAQIWLEDVSIQPMLVGYSIPGYANIPAKYHSQIVDQIATTARRREMIFEFSESMYREGKRALLLNGELVSNDGKPETSARFAKQIAELESLYKVDIRRGSVVTTIALTSPEKLADVTEVAIETAVTGNSTATNNTAANQIISDIDRQNNPQSNQ